MASQNVEIEVDQTKPFKYDKISVVVYRRDRIIWKLKKKNTTAQLPFAIIIKAPVSPLNWSYKELAPGSKRIVGTVRADAEPGFYPYAVCVADGADILVDDPEIIVHPPKR